MASSFDRVPGAEAFVVFELCSREAIANGATGSDEATAHLQAAEAVGFAKVSEAEAEARAALKRSQEAQDTQSQAAAYLLLAGLAAGTHSAIEADNAFELYCSIINS